MRGRIIVFPIKGRKWCFSSSNSIDHNTTFIGFKPSHLTLKQLWHNLITNHPNSNPNNSNSNPNSNPNNNNNNNNNIAQKAEMLIDFVSTKMNRAWDSLGKAPPGTFKSKIHGVGLRLLSRVEPSEIFLKTISKEVTGVDVTFPSSLNARLVRRRLRHIAQRGTIIHKKYLYGSVILLPFTSVLMVLPLPNIPFFWILFRSYSHWRALKGSERLLILASDDSATHNSSVVIPNKKSLDGAAEDGAQDSTHPTWMLQPSEELEQLIKKVDLQTGLSDSVVSKICSIYDLNTMDVIKYRDMA